MSREAHVRIWERVGVRFPCATRHIVTDTGGLLVGAEVPPADVQDRDGAVLVIEAIHQLFPWQGFTSRSGSRTVSHHSGGSALNIWVMTSPFSP